MYVCVCVYKYYIKKIFNLIKILKMQKECLILTNNCIFSPSGSCLDCFYNYILI